VIRLFANADGGNGAESGDDDTVHGGLLWRVVSGEL
jgi:hypothetical protein